MLVHGITPILSVTSVGESFEWFERLGWKRGFAWNGGGMIRGGAATNEHGPATFGSVCNGVVEIFLCVGAQGAKGTIEPKYPGDDEIDGVWLSWWLGSPAEVDQLHELAVRTNARVTYPPTNEPWGVREFHLRHPDGHTFRISAGIK